MANPTVGEALDAALDDTRAEIAENEKAIQALQEAVQTLDGRVTALEGNIEPPPPPPEDKIVFAASLSMADVQAAINQVTEPGMIVQLPAGEGWGASALVVDNEHRPHIRGADWLPNTEAYEAVIDEALARVPQIKTASNTNAIRALFQPTTTDVSFRINSPGVKLSRLGMVNLDINAPDSVVWFSRVESSVDYNYSHGPGLFADSFAGRVNGFSRNVGFDNTQADWESIPINPGGLDMPYAERVVLFPGNDASHATDVSWQGGKLVFRHGAIVCGAGNKALMRFHGFYYFSNGARVNSGRYFEAYDIDVACHKNLGWTVVDAFGGGGTIHDIRVHSGKSKAIAIGTESPDIRSADWRNAPKNPKCDELTMDNYPYDGQIVGDGVTGLYVWNFMHRGQLVTDDQDSDQVHLGCSVGKILQKDRDYHFRERPGYAPLGEHPLRSEMS